MRAAMTFIGAVLLQKFHGVLCSVAYASHTMTCASHTMAPAERNYSATRQERVATIFALKKFDMYLDETTLTILMDHQPLAWLKNLKDPLQDT